MLRPYLREPARRRVSAGSSTGAISLGGTHSIPAAMIPATLLTDSDATETSSASYTVRRAQAREKGDGASLVSPRASEEDGQGKRDSTRKDSVRAESEPFPPQLAESVPQSA